MPKSKMTKGVVYAACGSKYIKEAIESARSLKRENPNLSITLFENEENNISENEIFDKVKTRSTNENRIKIESILDSPYDHTLFIDSDTYICGDIYEMFDLLKRFDMAAAQAPVRSHPTSSSQWEGYSIQGVPSAFPEFNTGVLLFNSISESVNNMLVRWMRHYEDVRSRSTGRIPDQPAFRKAVFESEINVATLPREYNLRLPFPAYIYNEVKIVHGRIPSPKSVANYINNLNGSRIYIPGLGVLSKNNIIFRVLNKLQRML